MEYNQEVLDEIRAMPDYELSSLAECGLDNEAASHFLIDIRNAVICEAECTDPEIWEWEMVDDYNGSATELADNAVSIYTHTKWEQFIGTRAWDEDISDWGEISDMDEGASRCLYVIAQRLVGALAGKILESMADTDVFAELGL